MEFLSASKNHRKYEFQGFATLVKEQPDDLFEIIAFPNPVEKELTIDFGKSLTDGELILTDIMGKEITKIKVFCQTRESAFDVSLFPNGIYILNVKTSFGSDNIKIVVTVH